MKPSIAAAALMLTSASAAFAAPVAPRAEAPAHAPGEVIVQLKERVSNLHRDAALAGARARIIEHVNSPWADGDGPKGLMRVATDLPVEEAVAQLMRDPSVAFAEPNWICRTEAVSNDTYYTGGSLWGTFGNDLPVATGPAATTNAYGSQCEKAWGAGHLGARTVYVGIVDEGAQFDHPDLAANFWTNPFDPMDGIDNDLNGYIDDAHGWDFFNRDNSVYDGEGDNHGTHVAGTIGALGGNGVGVAGVCWNVTLISTKFLGPDTGRVSDAVKALDYLTDLKVRHGLNVVAGNHSWSTNGYSQALNDAVIRAAKQGILTIAAAGNSALDNDSNIVYPANFDTTRSTSTQTAATYDAVISVAAIDKFGALASFSDFGATSVDLGAPGVGIASTLPPSRYGAYSGTSMATPHVTGAAALIAAARPGIQGAELRQALLGSVIATPSLAGKTVTGGRLNVGDGALVGRDVAVLSLTTPSAGVRGSTVSVTTLAANEGNATETFTVTMTGAPPAGGTSGVFSAGQTITLAPGASRTLSFTWNLANASTGTHVATAAASRLNGETDVADNTQARSMTVTAAPIRDVAVRSLTAPSSGVRGSTVSVTTLVANEGNATETFTVAMTGAPPAGGTSGVFSPGQTIALAPGGSRTLSFTWNLTNASAGTHVATAAASHLSGETDVADNTLARSMTVTAAPIHDVAVLSVTTPPMGLCGTTVNTSAVATNEGNATATFTVTMTDAPPAGGTPGFFSGGQTITLAPGASRTLSFAWNLTNASPGTHVVTAAASRLYGETDVADNTRTTSMLVNAAPIVSTVNPTNVLGGTAVSVTVSGNYFAPGASLTFQNGGGVAPVATNVVVASTGRTLTALVTNAVDPQRLARTWDVVVTNPDGLTGRRAQLYRVNP